MLNKFKFEYKITLLYLVFGLIWIFFSDKIVNYLVVDKDLQTQISIIKGFFYVVLTGLLLFFLVRRNLRNLIISKLEIEKSEKKFKELFEKHTAVKFIIDPTNGQIIDANIAATEFYGYSRDQLLKMKIMDINIMDPQEAIEVMDKAQNNIKNYFEFKHRKADGTIVDVEAFSSKVTIDGKEYLHSIIHDVTDKRKLFKDLIEAKERAEKSEERNKTLIEAIPDLIFVVDKNGFYLDYQANETDLLYAPPEKFLGKKIVEIMPQELSVRIMDKIERVFNSQKYETLEYSLEIGGIINHYEARFVYDTSNTVLIFARNISDKIASFEKIKLTKDTYESIFNTVSEAIYILDEKGIFVDVNKGAEKMYGYSREEFIGKSPADVSAPGKNDLEYVKNIINQVSEDGIPRSFEFWGVRKNGEEFPKEVIINKGKYFGKDYIIATSRDISEHKQALKELIEAKEKAEESEKKYSMIVANSPDFVILQSPDGTTTFISENVAKITGLESVELIGNNLPLDRIYSEDLEKVFNTFKILQQGHPIVNLEYRFIRKDGQIIWVNHNAVPIVEDGQIVAIQSNVSDITIRKNLEIELLYAFNRLEESQRELIASQKVARVGYYILDVPKNRWTNSEMLDELFGIDKDYERSVEGWFLSYMKRTNR